MREIKFRAWDIGSKKMCHDFQWILNKNDVHMGGGYPISFSYSKKEDRPLMAHGNSNSSNFIIEQYTGLKDKNGKEIYEGDILVMDSEKYPDDDPCPYSVVFEDGCYRIKYVNWDETISKPILTKSQLSILHDIVAGNIHENPELLKAHP